MIENDDLKVQAKANTIENYGFAFDKSLLDHSIQRRDSNETIFAKLMNDGSFQDAVKKALLPIVYDAQQNGGET
jgi:type I restriction enzyme R subunit